MYKGREVLGLPVIRKANGENLGKISDLFCSKDLNYVKALQVLANNDKDVKVCQLQMVLSLGRDAIIINSNELENVEVGDDFGSSWQKIKGTKVICGKGNELGCVEDIVFEFPSGQITALEVSEGFIGDIISGRHIVSQEAIQTTGNNTIIVDF
ncbi:PRC-barrel domain-containing protein [Bacillota bacterium LX-D]|nr:PRC-barrel domain-containing protein [Bacillota bacterium LX-D]